MSCAVCGHPDTRRKLRKGEVDILECRSCGLAFWTPPEGFRATAQYDAAYFGEGDSGAGYDDYAALERSLRRTFGRRLGALGAPPAGGGRLLDVGAAYGFAVAEAARRGWQALGVEVSVGAARIGARTAPGRLAAARADAAPFPDACFDALTLWDVIEHLADPHAAVGEAARLLRPGGRIALSTGDVASLVARLSGARWHLYSLPEHLFFFSRKSLGILLERHGFRVDSMRAESAWYTLGYLAERLGKTLLGGRRLGDGRWPGARIPVPVNLFDIVTVRARRQAE